MKSTTPKGVFALGLEPGQFKLPHPRIGLPVILLIRQVLIRAFTLLRQSVSLEDLTEDEITAALRSRIENDLRQTGSVRGFDRRTFETVHRQSQIFNFDFTKRAKAPDLCFRLRYDDEENRSVIAEHDALFVECKPVDDRHAAGNVYCDDGLLRFVVGDYAWAMEEGLMVGYCRHGRSIRSSLLKTMLTPGRQASLRTVEPLCPVGTQEDAGCDPDAEPLHVSIHRRDFDWIEGKGRATPIHVYHSWHRCD